MWDVLVRTPRGRLHPRKFSLLLATFFVALLGYIFIVSPTAYAADATWDGDTITYQGNSYDSVSDSSALPSGIQQGSTVYRYVDDSKNPDIAHFVYFTPQTTDPKSAKEATYIRYTLNPPNDYSNPVGEKTLSLTPVNEPPSQEGEATSCAVDNIGWLVCGLAGSIADGVDTIYGWIAAFLTVQPLSTTNDSSLYRLWDIMRNFANVLFVIGFLVIIYSYLVGGGFNGYDIRRILPRIVVAAILINISYWICAIAVDLSNIVGMSLQELLIHVRETSVAVEENRNVGWGEITTYILSGGTIGALGFLAATGGSVVSFAWLLFIVLITIIFSLFVAFVILAARQAVIIMLIILAPIAFAAFILPNTEKWFDRWRGIFTTLLILFPIFSLLFGGAQLAGAAIIQNAPNLAIMLFGMAVQIVPLVITPLLIQFSGGLIGRIAGVVNNSQKGLFDRSKNWAQDRADYAKDRALANDNNWYNFARRGGQAMYRGTKNREDRRKNYQQIAENRRMNRSSYDAIDHQRREAEREHKRIEAHHQTGWNRHNMPGTAGFARELEARTTEAESQQTSQALDSIYTAAQSFQQINPGDNAETIAAKNKHNAQLRAQGLTAQYDGLMTNAAITSQALAIEGLKKTNAEVVLQGQIAGALKSDEDLRIKAGFIAGEGGQNRVYAKARSDIVQAYLDDVKNSRSVLSEHSLSELLEIQEKGYDRRNKQDVKDNVALRDAALQEILLTKGNNWSAQKIKDSVAIEHGMIYDDTDNKYYEVQRDNDGNPKLDANRRPMKGTEILDQDRIDRNRDVQQMMNDAFKNSKLAIKNYSGTDRGNAEVGTFVMTGRTAILRDIQDKKINAGRLQGTDIDELMRMVQILRDDSARAELSDSSRQALSDTIQTALTDPRIREGIAEREAEMMGVIHSYLTDLRPNIPLADKQRYESYAETAVDTNYVIDQVFNPGGKGPA